MLIIDISICYVYNELILVPSIFIWILTTNRPFHLRSFCDLNKGWIRIGYCLLIGCESNCPDCIWLIWLHTKRFCWDDFNCHIKLDPSVAFKYWLMHIRGQDVIEYDGCFGMSIFASNCIYIILLKLIPLVTVNISSTF